MSGEEEEVGDDTSSDNEDEEMVVSIFLKFFFVLMELWIGVHRMVNSDIRCTVVSAGISLFYSSLTIWGSKLNFEENVFHKVFSW